MQQNKVYQDVVITVLTWVFRIGLGATFIFSGIVKAIDPWGTVYKLHDYIMAMPGGVLDAFVPLLTVGCFVLFTAEVLLGIAVITGSYRRLSAIGAVLMMLIMLPLTVWIAIKNPVPDCGCFGDALTLTNTQTLWKNVALSLMAVWLVIFNKRARCLILPTLQWLMVVGTVIFAVGVGFIGYSVQPMIDFRPYPVGGTLIDSAADTSDTLTQDMMSVWQRGDERITIPADSIPEGEDWEFVERLTSMPSAGDTSEQKNRQKGLAIFDESADVTEDLVVSEGEQVVVFMTNLPHLSSGNFYKLNSLYAYCRGRAIPMFAIVAATPLEIQDFIDHSLAEYPIYSAEDTAIKEVVRGNPGVVYLNNGKIGWKQALSAIPTYDFLESTPACPFALKTYAPHTDAGTFKGLCLIWGLFLIIVIILSHVPMVIRYTSRKIRKNKWIKEGTVVKVSTAVIASSLLLTSCDKASEPPIDPSIDPANTRTILVYMVATNSLAYDSTDDIAEILEGYKATAEGCTNLLIYKADYNEASPTLCVVTTDREGIPYLKTLKSYQGAESSVSKSRVEQVMADMKALAPADDYGLFLWSHASGWLPPATPAERVPHRSFGDDYGKAISITALAQALPLDTFSFIWMDCCYMGSIEVVYQLRNHCEVIVCSPTEMLAGGAPYQDVLPFLLGPEVSIEGAVMATFNFYANNPNTRYRSCTMSVVRTPYLSALAATAANIARSGVRDVSTYGLQQYGRYNGITFYDLQQTFERMDAPQEQYAPQLEANMGQAVSLKLATPKFLNLTINPEHFSGLSCHIPAEGSSSPSEVYYRTLDWYRDVYMR